MELHGLWTILGDAGFTVVELRPGIDAVSLIDRSFHGLQTDPQANRWFVDESPRNVEIDAEYLAPRHANFRKLLFCGQFVAAAANPEPDAHSARSPDDGSSR